jgi:hypothetical protein
MGFELWILACVYVCLCCLFYPPPNKLKINFMKDEGRFTHWDWAWAWAKKPTPSVDQPKLRLAFQPQFGSCRKIFIGRVTHNLSSYLNVAWPAIEERILGERGMSELHFNVS